MVIISKTYINSYCINNPEIKNALTSWYEISKNANWKNYHDLKESFNSADSVGNDRYVFNIKGNQYRLIALILFKTRTLFILFIGNHQEYNKINANKIEYEKQ